MAHLIERANSPFFWIGYRDLTGAYKREATKFRIKNSTDVRNAKRFEAEMTLKEFDSKKVNNGESWSVWVVNFLKVRYKTKPTTLERYLGAWTTISLFLKEAQIDSPRQLTRRHCFDYISWRQTPNKRIGKYKACHNTALLELKILRIIMHEAVEQDLAIGNPCIRLNIEREERKLKPELSPAAIELIREKINEIADADEKEFFHLSFEIARYQGCRLKETMINPQTDVQIAPDGLSGTIQFHAKGGKDFATLLHPKLIPIFQQLKTTGRTTTWSTPPDRGRQWASAKWFRFIDRIGLKEEYLGACFHSTRVTVVTELARENVPTSKAKDYVGHASTLVHDTYKRLRPEDLVDCVQSVG